MTDVEKAAAVVRSLEEKREQCVRRGIELADARAAIALDAHTGNSKARKQLDEINGQIATHASELASYDAALRAAGERLEAARQAEALERDRANALEVRKLLQSYAATSEVLDDLLAQFVGVSNQRKALLDHIHELGFNMPSTEMDHSTGERAIKSALQLTPYRRAFESLRPAERKGFTEDTAARVANVEQNRIIPLLGEQQISEPEAA